MLEDEIFLVLEVQSYAFKVVLVISFYNKRRSGNWTTSMFNCDNMRTNILGNELARATIGDIHGELFTRRS